MEETQNDLLTEFSEHLQMVRANTAKRFLNLLIDYAVCLLLMFGIGFILALLSPAIAAGLTDNGSDIGVRLVGLLIYGLYMSLLEAVTKGRSLGKFITGTKAVNEDGSNITARTAFRRGFSRIVPFEILSGIGNPPNPWHDKWNQTYVIDIKQSYLN